MGKFIILDSFFFSLYNYTRKGGLILKSVIEVSNLTNEYNKVLAINNLSFEVYEGEILGLLRTKWKWKINNNKLYTIIIKI